MTTSLGIYIFVVITISFIVKGLVGFGDPLLFNPLLSMQPVLSSKNIAPAMLPVSILLNGTIVYRNRKDIVPKTIAPIAFWDMLGVIPGTLLLKLGAPWIIKVFLGLLIIGLGIEMMTRDSAKSGKPNMILQTIMCFGSGITAGLFGINLLFLIYLERTAKNRGEFRGSVCLVFLLENVFRAFVYTFTGVFKGDALILPMALIAAPSALLGMFIGLQIDKHIDEMRIKKLIVYVFILGGISTVVKALITHS